MEWQPIPVLLPGKSHGRRSMVGLQSLGAQSWTRLSDFTFTFNAKLKGMWAIYILILPPQNILKYNAIRKNTMNYFYFSNSENLMLFRSKVLKNISKILLLYHQQRTDQIFPAYFFMSEDSILLKYHKIYFNYKPQINGWWK